MVHDQPALYWAAIVVGLVIITLLRKVRRSESVLGVLLIWLLLLLMYGMFLPAGLAGGSAVSLSKVTVIDRKTVGVYDTATLRSPDGQAVFDWMAQNGFPTPTNIVPTLRAYAQEGWCFVASRIRLEGAAPTSAKAHPLALTFKTQRPVYPLRLTGIGNDSCRVELYVFGPGRAEAPAFTVERCGVPSYQLEAQHGRWRRLEELSIQHPLLRRLVANSPAATKLVGRLTHRQMQQDAYLSWSAPTDTQRTLYSREGAMTTAADIAVSVLVAGLLVTYWGAGSAPGRRQLWSRIGIGLVLAALAGGPAVFYALPKTEVVTSRRPGYRLASTHLGIAGRLAEAWKRPGPPATQNTRPDAAWVRQQLAENSQFRRALGEYQQTNPVTGQPWREEDSPGNCTLRETADGLDYVWYDLNGAENVVPLFR